MYKAHVKLSKAKKRALKDWAPVNDLLLENRSQQETDIAVDPSILKNCNEALMSQNFVCAYPSDQFCSFFAFQSDFIYSV